MTKPLHIVENGTYRQAPLVATTFAVVLGAAALFFVPTTLADGPRPAEASTPMDSVPFGAQVAAPARDGALTSRLLRDLVAQENTMKQARSLIASSDLRDVFEADLRSVHQQIEAEQRRLLTLRSEGYTAAVVCGDRIC